MPPPSGGGPCTDSWGGLGTVGGRVGGAPTPPPTSPGPPALGVGQEQTRSRGTTVDARAWVRGGGARAPARRVVVGGGRLTREGPARERASERACGLRMPGPLIGRLGRCGCALGARPQPWGRARTGVSGARAPGQQTRRIGRRAAGVGGAALLGNCGRSAGGPRSAAPPRPYPRPGGAREWALSRARAGAPAPAGPCSLGEINTMTGRKTSACKLGKISHRDSASIQRGFREEDEPRKAKPLPSFLPTSCLSKFCLLIR